MQESVAPLIWGSLDGQRKELVCALELALYTLVHCEFGEQTRLCGRRCLRHPNSIDGELPPRIATGDRGLKKSPELELPARNPDPDQL
jgi:hypothetical protein